MKHHQAGQLADAHACYQKALTIDPDHPDALHLAGVSLLQQRRFKEAEPFIARAVEIRPDNPNYRLNFGLALKGAGRAQEALASYRAALKLNPQYAEAYNCMGTLLNHMGDHRKSISALKKAIEIKPDYAEAHLNMGNAFQWLGLPGESIPCYRRAIRIKPDYANAYNSMGNALEGLKKKEAALECFRNVLKLEPGNLQAFSSYVHLLQHTCQWRRLEPLSEKMHQNTVSELAAGVKTSQSPFVSLTRQDDPRLNMEIARSWSRELACSISQTGIRFSFEQRPRNPEKLKIGYISSDFMDHPVAHLCAGMFQHHSRERFHIYCFSAGVDDGSEYRRRIRETCDHFIDIRGMAAIDAARLIHRNEVDILVDLSGHTGAHRLDVCALKPAPIQASWLGFTGTSGSGFIDYIIVDQIVAPVSQAEYYTEKCVYMPDCYQISDDKCLQSSYFADRRSEKLPGEGMVFCSFNSPYKIEPVMFAVWMRILKRTPNSVLWLSGMNRTARRRLRQAAESHHVSAGRLVFSKRVPSKADHLIRHGLADLALDTRIFNGHATTADALWAGVPVLTLPGRQFASRVAASVLTSAGLPELIVNSLQEYENLAVSLAENSEKLNALRRRLIENRTCAPFFNTKRFVGHLETAYAGMWRNLIEHGQPKTIEVSVPVSTKSDQPSPGRPVPFDLNLELQRAVRLHQTGKVEQAEEGYKKILGYSPDQPDALNLSGVIEYRRGNYKEAERRIGRALSLVPNSPGIVNNLGLVLVKLGKPAEAAAHYRSILSINPNLFDVNNNLGLALEKEGKPDEAEACFRKALEIRPEYLEAMSNLGRLLQKRNRLDEAEAWFRKLLEIDPANTSAFAGMGSLYGMRMEFDRSIAWYKQGLEVSPENTELRLNLGNAYNRAGRYAEAIPCYQAVLKQQPEHYDALINMGSALKQSGRNKDAESCYRKAVEVQPQTVMGNYNLGTLLRDIGKQEEAILYYRRTLAVEPGHIMAANNLYGIFEKLCRWDDLAVLGLELDTLSDACLAEGRKTVETPMSSVSRYMNPERNYRVAESWSREIENRTAELKIEFVHKRSGRERLRIGYVSSDLNNHPVGHLMAGVFELHDRRRFEIYCYASGKPDACGYRDRIKAGCGHFIDIEHTPHPEAAKRINADEIDILVDLNGHTTGARLEVFALRPAPINITYLGFPGTTGAAFIDYLIADETVVPKEHEPWYSERLIMMPHTFQVNDNSQPVGSPPGRASAGLPEDRFVFCSFNNIRKIEPGVFDAWMQILKQSGNSVLWMAGPSGEARKNLKFEAGKRGVDPKRLLFAGKLPAKADHLARIGLADIALDPFIYNGHTTTTDSLWAGVPVLTLLGNHFASRTSAGLLNAAGMPEMIARSRESYIRKAVELFCSKPDVERLKETLRRNKHQAPLFDTPAFVRRLETAYRIVWEKFKAGKAPAGVRL